MVIYPEQGANEMQMVQLMPCHCHPIISCFIKIRNGFTFLVSAYPLCPRKRSH